MIDVALIQDVVDQAQAEIDRLEHEAEHAVTDLVRVRHRAIATGMRLVQTDLVRLLAEAAEPKTIALSVGVTLRAHDPEAGCLDCPLRTHAASCFVTGQRVDQDALASAPEWCPIRTGGVMVSSRKVLGEQLRRIG